LDLRILKELAREIVELRILKDLASQQSTVYSGSARICDGHSGKAEKQIPHPAKRGDSG